MKTEIILFIAFSIMDLVALYILIYLDFRKLIEKSKPNVFLKKTNTGCYQPNIDFTTNPPCNDKRFFEAKSDCGSPDAGEFTHHITFNNNGILDSYYNENKKKLDELEDEKDLRISKLSNISYPLISILKAASRAAGTVKLVNDYHQAIEQENYELAGELHKRIEALKNENTAHND